MNTCVHLGMIEWQVEECVGLHETTGYIRKRIGTEGRRDPKKRKRAGKFFPFLQFCLEPLGQLTPVALASSVAFAITFLPEGGSR